MTTNKIAWCEFFIVPGDGPVLLGMPDRIAEHIKENV